MNRLNPQQKDAVITTDGALLILAGAGSGKTHVITKRIAYLLKNRFVPAENILAVTFTNKAAKEMKSRVKSIAGKIAEDVTISTFHSFGVQILRRNIKNLGFKPNFSIYTTSDQIGVIRQAMREKDIDTKEWNPEIVQWRISALKNALISPDSFKPKQDDYTGKVVAKVYKRYQELLKGYNAIDFDDIIMLSVELLENERAILEHWQDRFKYIMVDEYQDTNGAQYRLISLVAAKHKNICVVGDDDQSIYGWRGADISKILNFEKDYPKCKVIKLEQNYRSTSSILNAANAVIKNNRLRSDKALWSAVGSGRTIDMIIGEDEDEEASKVMDAIMLEQYSGNLKWSDFAILYRSNAQSRIFEEKLRRERIPYIVIGGQQFYERKEVKDAVAYLRVIDNLKDEASLLRIINFPRRGIGDTTLVKLNQYSLQHNISLFETIKRVDEIPDIAASAKSAVQKFYVFLNDVIKKFDRSKNLGEQTNRLFTELRIEDELYRTLNDLIQAKKRIENIEQIINSLAFYEERNCNPTLSDYLESISLIDEDDDKKGVKDDCVTLISLHSSKGLEFENVFLVGMEENILPHKRSIEEDPTVAEERRLCYVGITRAKKHLTISYSKSRRSYGSLEKTKPSRFISEIPIELIAASSDSVDNVDSAKLAEDFFAKMLG